MRACRPKEAKRRESPGPLAPLFICFFLPPGLRYVNCASQECCLFYLRSSLLSSDFPLAFLCSVFTDFPSLSFSHHHFGLFPILPNIMKAQRGTVTCPRLHSKVAVLLRQKPKSSHSHFFIAPGECICSPLCRGEGS